MGEILDCLKLADKIKRGIKTQVSGLKQKPRLISIQACDSEPACVYIRNQKKQAELLGIDYDLLKLKPATTYAEIIKAIKGLNLDPGITGIIIQMPVPMHLDTKVLHEAIDPMKDAEGMHPSNLGKVLLGTSKIAPCTPSAVMSILEHFKIDIYGRNVVCVGHSNIVGKPLSLMLLNKYATTSVCHVATSERKMLKDYVSRAEILIVAVGKPCIVKGDWIKKGAVVIDVGINRINGKIVGDVEFDKASKRASMITPVPGGVGPLTTAMLMRNVMNLYALQKGKK